MSQAKTVHRKQCLLGSLGATLLSSIVMVLSRSDMLESTLACVSNQAANIAHAQISAIMLFISRFIQAFASSSIFALGVATIYDNMPSSQLGKTMGLVTIDPFFFGGEGNVRGTTVAGMLLQLGGYWAAWSTAFALVICDGIMRLLMIEIPLSPFLWLQMNDS